jgi:hypothetical protein
MKNNEKENKNKYKSENTSKPEQITIKNQQ